MSRNDKQPEAGSRSDKRPFPVRLTGNLIAVREVKATGTKGGLVLPEVATIGTPIHEVLAVGPGKRNEQNELVPMQTKVGDVVFILPCKSMKLPVDGDVLDVLQEDHVAAIVEDITRLYMPAVVIAKQAPPPGVVH